MSPAWMMSTSSPNGGGRRYGRATLPMLLLAMCGSLVLICIFLSYDLLPICTMSRDFVLGSFFESYPMG